MRKSVLKLPITHHHKPWYHEGYPVTGTGNRILKWWG